jgi:hypothetical protein
MFVSRVKPDNISPDGSNTFRILTHKGWALGSERFVRRDEVLVRGAPRQTVCIFDEGECIVADPIATEFDHTPLSFLTSLSSEERSNGMSAEVHDALAKERKALGSGVWSTAFRILFKPQKADASKIAYLERSCKNIPNWILSDATGDLIRTLQNKNPFCLYLRAYSSESIQELSADASAVRLWRSIEIANLSRVSELISVYGLCNALDMNPLRKYRSVWLPRQFRNHWQDIVRELANRSVLIVINATRPGSGLSIELEIIPNTFPEKTWLLAGTVGEAEKFATAEIERAASILESYPDHVSKARVDDDTVHDAWPIFPKWVQEICLEARRAQLSLGSDGADTL